MAYGARVPAALIDSEGKIGEATAAPKWSLCTRW
jgi:hypothetical protein